MSSAIEVLQKELDFLYLTPSAQEWKIDAYRKALLALEQKDKAELKGRVEELKDLIDINNSAWLDSHGELKSDLDSRSCYAGYSIYLNKILEKRLNTLKGAERVGEQK